MNDEFDPKKFVGVDVIDRLAWVAREYEVHVTLSIWPVDVETDVDVDDAASTDDEDVDR